MQQQQATELCANGCGFFGAPGSGGMCSVCWKKTMSDRQVATDQVAPTKQSEVAPLLPSEGEKKEAEVALQTPDEQPQEKRVQKNKKRCWECRKKVGLTAIACRCGFVFCGEHRYADQHQCSFDFKAADRAELARLNPGGGQFEKLEKV